MKDAKQSVKDQKKIVRKCKTKKNKAETMFKKSLKFGSDKQQERCAKRLVAADANLQTQKEKLIEIKKDYKDSNEFEMKKIVTLATVSTAAIIGVGLIIKALTGNESDTGSDGPVSDTI